MKRYVAAALALWCAGCSQVPVTPPGGVTVAATFKEAKGAWTTAETDVSLPSQSWWSIFQDAELNVLEEQLLQNSPDLATALARYQQARAATDVLRAAQSPGLGTSANVQRNRQSERRPLRVLGPNSPDEYNSATFGLDFAYEVDLWGRVRQQVNAGVAQEQAAQADLAAAKLALQVQLADTLIALRGMDEESRLLRETVAAYARNVEMIERRHQNGIASGLDVARAQVQLESTRSQMQQVQGQRAVLEHAIAALTGANASNFSITPKAVSVATPLIPVGVPSTLLQRRPDIAAAQLRVTAAAARLGMAKTAFFPTLNLNASTGLQSSNLAKFVEMPNLYWVLGPTLALNLLDGGRRKAQIADAEAVLDENGQRYRAVVLSAFQQVEDQLALLVQYGEAAKADSLAAASAQRALELASKRYQQGVINQIEVIVAQTAYLQAQRSTLDLNTKHRRATVQLVRALGGGWSTDQITAQTKTEQVNE